MLAGAFILTFGLGIAVSYRNAKKLGPKQIAPEALRSARVVILLHNGDSTSTWTKVGSATSVDGLSVRFDAADDPAAEAQLHIGAKAFPATGLISNKVLVSLQPEYTDAHVHSAGYVALLSVRGTPHVVGRKIKLKMRVTRDGSPHSVCIENEDDLDPAIGGWIEIRRLAVLQLS